MIQSVTAQANNIGIRCAQSASIFQRGKCMSTSTYRLATMNRHTSLPSSMSMQGSSLNNRHVMTAAAIVVGTATYLTIQHSNNGSKSSPVISSLHRM
jgi:hypothetical protein